MFVAPCTALIDIAGIAVECVAAWVPEDMLDIAEPDPEVIADAGPPIAVEDAAILLVALPPLPQSWLIGDRRRESSATATVALASRH
jgi:hypothetical protein